MTKSILIFRHGETDWNRDRRLQGSRDIPLNETGREQAEALRRYFNRHPVDVFLSSDLMRARQTAEIAGQDLKVPILLDPRLRETHLGLAEGLTREDIDAKWGQEMWQKWAAHHPPDPHHRFPEGESKAEHLARLLVGLEENLRKHPYARWGVASHGGAIRRILHHLMPDLANPVMVPNGTLYELSFHVESGLRLIDVEPRQL